MARYVLNIKTRKIHDSTKGCSARAKITPSNSKEFDRYEDAVNFFEGRTEKGIPCGICMKRYLD